MNFIIDVITIPVYFLEILICLLFKKLTFIILGSVAVGMIIRKWYLSFRANKEGLLTFKLEQELQSFNRKRPPKLLLWFEDLYLPSWKSVLSVIGSVTLLLVVSHTTKLWSFELNSLKFIDGNHYQNLIAIYAGIGAIIFALLIFIAESLRDDETKDRARVLLQESFLFPLTVLAITGFLIFVWGDVNMAAVLPLFLIAALTVASLWRLLAVLLSRSLFAKKRLKMLKDRIRKSIDTAISERFCNNILLKELGEDKIELEFYPLSLDDEDKASTLCFHADKTGIIKDIRLNKLNEFSKLAEREANRNGFSFYKEKVKQSSNAPTDTAATTETSQEKFKQAHRQFLHKKYGDEVNADSQILLCLEKEGIQDSEVIKKLTKLSKEIFIIKKQDNFSEEIKLEIDGLKDQFIAAISDKKLGKIEELTKTYVALAESFLELLEIYGGGYTYEQAIKERGNIFDGWNEMRWLSDSIREIYIKATQSHDEEIIRDVAYLPVSIAIRAIKSSDQFLYQEFLKFPSFLYTLALKEPDMGVKEFMIDRSWRHLKEMSDYFIEYQLKRKAPDVKSVQRYKEFTIPIFFAFQNLLKTAFDKQDFDSFEEFLGKFLEIYRDFDPQNDHPNAESLKYSLQWAKDDTQKEEIQKRIELQQERETAAKDIQVKKRQVVFGLSAWVFEQYRKQSSDQLLGKFFSTIYNQLPTRLNELTTLYISTRQFEVEHFWNWDQWEMIPDGHVHSIDFNSKLDRLYCVRALQILPEDIEDSSKLPPSRDLAFLAENRADNRTLMAILDQIAANPEQWGFILNKTRQAKIPKLKELLEASKKDQEEIEEKFLETADIDLEKLAEFKKELISTFDKSGILRQVATKLSAFRDLTNEVPETQVASFGYNQIDNKAALIKNWHVHYAGWGEQYGQGMANSEDQMIFEEIVNGTQNKKNIVKQNTITEIIKIVAEKGFKNPVILQTLEYLFEYEQIKQSDLFLSEYNQKCPKTKLTGTHGYMGVLNLSSTVIPMVDVYVRKVELKNKVVVLDLKEFGSLNQYSPVDNPEDKRFKERTFYLRVIDLNKEEEFREKIITENPSWLQKYQDRAGYLKRHVLIKLFQKFKFEIKNPEMAHVLNVTDASVSTEED